MTMKSEVAGQLKSFLERVERLEAERKDLGDDIRAAYAEAKSMGFDPKAIRAIVKRRRKEAAEVAEEEAIFETYMQAIGMTLENPLSSAVAAMSHDAMARDEVIDVFKKLVPMHGEIIANVGGAPLRIWRGEDDIARAEEYVAPAAKPIEKIGRHAKPHSATVLSIVPTDSVKAAADAAEARSKVPKPIDGAPTEDDAEEPVE